MSPSDLSDVLDPSVFAWMGGATDASGLPATALSGVSATSALGKQLATLTIGDVSEMDRDAFVAHATSKVAVRQRKQASQQAQEVWQKAQRATGG